MFSWVYKAGQKPEKIQLSISNFKSEEDKNPSVILRFLKRNSANLT